MKKILGYIVTAGICAVVGYLKCMSDLAKQNPGETITVRFGKNSHMSMTEIDRKTKKKMMKESDDNE